MDLELVLAQSKLVQNSIITTGPDCTSCSVNRLVHYLRYYAVRKGSVDQNPKILACLLRLELFLGAYYNVRICLEIFSRFSNPYIEV